jgi:hypothetical protein
MRFSGRIGPEKPWYEWVKRTFARLEVLELLGFALSTGKNPRISTVFSTVVENFSRASLAREKAGESTTALPPTQLAPGYCDN